jgi:uncharacterized protein
MTQSAASAQEDAPIGETSLVLFRRSPIHGYGGFAKAAIAKDTRIVEYVGERISKATSLERCEQNNEFIFTLNEREDLDGNVAWNLARFINHSCAPNCEAELDDDRIWIIANRDIQPGEELTFNYGFDLTDYREYPCRCGSPTCVGFMVAEEFFEHIRRQRKPTESPQG